MEQKSLRKTKHAIRWKTFLFFFLLACGGLVSFLYVQSVFSGGFSLNSPVSFPVDI